MSGHLIPRPASTDAAPICQQRQQDSVQPAADLQKLARSIAAECCRDLHIRTVPPLRIQGIHKLALICSWLQRQAGLVSSIEVYYPHLWRCEFKDSDTCFDTAEQLLTLSLQTAAGAQLRSFSTRIVRSPALLCALPAAALTRLELQHSSAWRSSLDLNSSSIAAALTQLSNLRSLQLAGSVGDACMAAVGQLAKLTGLSVDSDRTSCQAAGSCHQQMLPPQLQQMTLKVSNGGAARITLQHVTALRDLNLLLVDCRAAAGSSLPASLTALTLGVYTTPPGEALVATVLSALTTATIPAPGAAAAAASMQHLNMTALQQLQRLTASNCLQQPQLLVSLSAVTALTYISLQYDATFAVQAAPAWQHLSALHSLYLQVGDDLEESGGLDPTQSLLLLQGLAAATSLTCLVIEGRIVHDSMQLCALDWPYSPAGAMP
uniref:F-box domain-containing protein n=1 Tax=Tetradesmus obliquus TaxID=3088 RepID=A0A383VTL5_TETOB|eukprot:jgi/Sobl393_1/3134/SZX68835.1